MRGTTIVACLALAGCSGRPAVLIDARVDGASDVGCAAGLTLCGGECVKTNTSLDHCGECDWVCNAVSAGGEPFFCDHGSCVHGDIFCEGGWKKICDAECRDLGSDNKHCGECGVQCDTANGFTCIAGECNCGKASDTLCDGECVDLQTDEQHCGECDHACNTANGFACISGSCECVGGLTDCYGVCVDTGNDPQHCGGCNTDCRYGPFDCQAGLCQGSICIPTCSVPLCPCDGACVDPTTDAANCGGCGITCVSGGCSGGQCQGDAGVIYPDAGLDAA